LIFCFLFGDFDIHKIIKGVYYIKCMAEYLCYGCGNKLINLATSSDLGKLFCGSKHSPLEAGSCALKYVESCSEVENEVYFFVNLGGKK